jgi:predicted nucleic acid-binding protein
VTAFFDTNVLVYCNDPKTSRKQTIALALVEQYGVGGDAAISTQVLIELYNVLVNKQKVSRKQSALVIENYCLWQVVESDVALVRNAVAHTLQYSLSIWDAMVVEAAIRAGSQILFSEDMAHDQLYGNVRVTNPFL